MAKIVVIGASAGGIEALKEVMNGLRPNLQAAIFVVVHISPDAPSILPEILNEAGPLAAMPARDGAVIAPSMVYVAQPDHHLLVEAGRMKVVRGARENRNRPAIDPLFRTAARAYGRDVIGIILSGMLDDGSAGMQIIKACGGTTIVQDPADAMFPSMPANTMKSGKPDFVLPVARISAKLNELVTKPWDSGKPERIRTTDDSVVVQGKVPMDDERISGTPSTFTCPECNGALWELEEGGMLRYRCRVGHAFAEDSVRAAYDESTEAALWSGLRALEESAALERRLASHAIERGNTTVAARFEDIALGREAHAATIRDMLLRNPLDKTG